MPPLNQICRVIRAVLLVAAVTPAAWAGVPVGSSTLIGRLDYSDTFYPDGLRGTAGPGRRRRLSAGDDRRPGQRHAGRGPCRGEQLRPRGPSVARRQMEHRHGRHGQFGHDDAIPRGLGIGVGHRHDADGRRRRRLGHRLRHSAEFRRPVRRHADQRPRGHHHRRRRRHDLRPPPISPSSSASRNTPATRKSASTTPAPASARSTRGSPRASPGSASGTITPSISISTSGVSKCSSTRCPAERSISIRWPAASSPT